MIDPNKMEWRQVQEFPHLEVSEYGDLRRTVARTEGGGRYIAKGYVYKVVKKMNGYSQYTLRNDGYVIYQLVHRLVALHFLEIPVNYKELEINHKDGNKTNNHYSNLEWCTMSENHMHSLYVLGNIKNVPKGSLHHNSKLIESDVVAIRKLYSENVRNKDIALIYPQVRKETISLICKGHRWKGIAI